MAAVKDKRCERTRDAVVAEGQYAILCKLVDEFGLSETELEWVRRGRNASARGPARPKSMRSTSLTGRYCT